MFPETFGNHFEHFTENKYGSFINFRIFFFNRKFFQKKFAQIYKNLFIKNMIYRL